MTSLETAFSRSFVLSSIVSLAFVLAASLLLHNVGDATNVLKTTYAVVNSDAVFPLQYYWILLGDTLLFLYVPALMLLAPFPAERHFFGVFVPLFISVLYVAVLLKAARASERRRRGAWLLSNRRLLVQLALRSIVEASEAEKAVVAAARAGKGDLDGSGEVATQNIEEANVIAQWSVESSRLTLVEVVGSGSYAQVWLATVSGLHTPCAAKQVCFVNLFLFLHCVLPV
jgi:hypothetical protein